MNTKQEVMENLVFADDYISAVFPEMKKLSFVISGGASFLLKGYTNKFTLDIDSVTEMDENVLSFLESFSINNAASEVTELSTTYKERLTKVERKFKILDVLVLGTEDLIISKIGRLSDDDLRDIEDTQILQDVNLTLLATLAKEVSERVPHFGHKWQYFKNYFRLEIEVD